MAEKLDAGATLPKITLRIAGGGSLTLPDELGSSYGVVLFYRGHW